MLKVSVISPEAVLFEGDAESVVAPAFDGEVGILENHAPMMTLLGNGVLRLGGGSGEAGRGNARHFNIEGGFLQVVDNNVRIVTERAEVAY
ncbi:MAG: ATP synthase F1 subunit epsilon [Gemmatimonadaceae bacterium]